MNLDLLVETCIVGDLVILLDQIQFFLDGKVILVLVLSDLEQNFNHVLNSLVNVGLVENVAELVEDGEGDLRVELFDVLTNFLHQAHGNLNTVISRLVQQEKQNLGGKHLMSDLLVDQMSKESSAAQANSFVISLVGLAELNNQPVNEQFSNLGQLGVDDCSHGSIDRGEGQTSSLSLHDATAEQTTSSDQVLGKQLGDNMLDVGDVDLVDQTVDGLFQSLPGHALKLF